eukprot:TRINITY_DN16343_c0_g1_i1.p1 TRINITY_DN16343_c0_g1~~TRINITY_DN16343_c0_g1_i1.p1  ORF type:complete len:175 (-),score=36.03 TRINITY_DN16343_c0_g1_i1:32-556(-)
MSATAEVRSKWGDEIKGVRTAMLTIREGGMLRALPMHVAHIDENQDLWFYTTISSPKIKDIEKDPKVGCTVQDGGKYISITGHAVVNRDRSKMEAYWSEGLRPWFPQGTNTPDMTLIHLISEEGEYWDYSSPLSKLNYLFKAAVAITKGKRMDSESVGSHDKVNLTRNNQPSKL